MITVDRHVNKPATTLKVQKIFLILDSNDFSLSPCCSKVLVASMPSTKPILYVEEYVDNHWTYVGFLIPWKKAMVINCCNNAFKIFRCCTALLTDYYHKAESCLKDRAFMYQSLLLRLFE